MEQKHNYPLWFRNNAYFDKIIKADPGLSFNKNYLLRKRYVYGYILYITEYKNGNFIKQNKLKWESVEKKKRYSFWGTNDYDHLIRRLKTHRNNLLFVFDTHKYKYIDFLEIL